MCSNNEVGCLMDTTLRSFIHFTVYILYILYIIYYITYSFLHYFDDWFPPEVFAQYETTLLLPLVLGEPLVNCRHTKTHGPRIKTPTGSRAQVMKGSYVAPWHRHRAHATSGRTCSTFFRSRPPGMGSIIRFGSSFTGVFCHGFPH